jgi:hypothetical protein
MEAQHASKMTSIESGGEIKKLGGEIEEISEGNSSEEDSNSKERERSPSRSSSQMPSNRNNEVISMIATYHSQNVPTPGQHLSFTLPGELHDYAFVCPVLFLLLPLTTIAVIIITD